MRAEVITTVTHGLVSELKSNYPRLNFRLVRNGFDELVFTDEFLNLIKGIFYRGISRKAGPFL